MKSYLQFEFYYSKSNSAWKETESWPRSLSGWVSTLHKSHQTEEDDETRTGNKQHLFKLLYFLKIKTQHTKYHWLTTYREIQFYFLDEIKYPP